MLLLTSVCSSAQLGLTRSEVIDSYGSDYKEDYTESGIYYIYYLRSITTEASGTYSQYRAAYFVKLDNGTLACYTVCIIEPLTETNYNVAFYNNKFVKIGDTKWKDYTNNFVYDLSVDKDMCMILIYFDNSD